MIGSGHRLSAVVLFTLVLSSANLVMSQSSPPDEDRTDVVRTVLEAEVARQVATFENVRQLSTENITSLIPTRVAADLKLTTLRYAEISDRAHSYGGAHYLRFKVFKIEGDRTLVRLSVVHEVTPCFGPYLKDQHDFTYRLTKMGGYWKAELIGNLPPSFMFGVEKLTLGKSF